MSKTKLWVTLIAVLSFGGVLFYQRLNAPLDYDQCIQGYAMKGKTDRIAGRGRLLCEKASNPSTSPRERKIALCTLQAIPGTPSEYGVAFASQKCEKDNPLVIELPDGFKWEDPAQTAGK